MASSSQILGLIAGNGKFPLLFAIKARSLHYHIVAAGVRGDTSWMMRFFVDQYRSFRVVEMSRMLDYLRDAGVKKVLMAGQVHPRCLFDAGMNLDPEFFQFFQAVKDRKADTIFAAIGEKLKERGMELIDSTILIKDYLAPRGTLTKRAPTIRELGDIEFGRSLAKMMGGMDVGQTVVIKDKAIVAVEAMEGTDQAILRGGRIAQRDAVVVKMSKPEQDFRFDVPVIGPRTIEHLKRSRCSCLAMEAGKTIIIDLDVCLKKANQAGICLVAS
jgi:UDP-2,3-diacylglucosamine hydrolase